MTTTCSSNEQILYKIEFINKIMGIAVGEIGAVVFEPKEFNEAVKVVRSLEVAGDTGKVLNERYAAGNGLNKANSLQEGVSGNAKKHSFDDTNKIIENNRH